MRKSSVHHLVESYFCCWLTYLIYTCMEQQIGTSRKVLIVRIGAGMCSACSRYRFFFCAPRYVMFSLFFCFRIFSFGYRLFGCWRFVACAFFCMCVGYNIMNVSWCVGAPGSTFFYTVPYCFLSWRIRLTTRFQVFFSKMFSSTLSPYIGNTSLR